MSGELSFFEIGVADAERAQRFYGELFGWRFEEGNFEGFYMIPNSSPVGGLNATGEGSGVHVYFTVADIREAAERVRESGGQAGELVEIPSGTFARCVDDQGIEFSLFQEPASEGTTTEGKGR